MDKLIRIVNRLDTVAFTIAQIAVFIMMILTTADALMRYIFNHAIVGAYLFSEKYLMVIIVFLSISYLWKLNGHIRIDLFTQYMPRVLVRALDVIYTILVAIFMFAIGYRALLMTYDAFINSYVTTGVVPWPIWLSWVWVPVGSFIFCIRLILDVVHMIVTFNQANSEAFFIEKSNSES